MASAQTIRVIPSIKERALLNQIKQVAGDKSNDQCLEAALKAQSVHRKTRTTHIQGSSIACKGYQNKKRDPVYFNIAVNGIAKRNGDNKHRRKKVVSTIVDTV